jgi:hypothetical protein
MKKKLLIFAFALIFFSCNGEMKFDSKKWNDFEDNNTFEYRNAMLNDLLNNYHLKGRNINEMGKIFGKIKENDFNKSENLLIFDVLQEWSGIEPVYNKYLNLKYNEKGIIDSVYITEYKH